MEIFIIILIIVAVVNASKKKQAEAEQQRRKAAAAATRTTADEKARAEARLRDYQAQRQKSGPRPTVAPTVNRPSTPQTGTWYCTECGARNNTSSRFCTECGKPRRVANASGSMEYESTEGLGSTEGRARPVSVSIRHVVKPMTESDHSHVESSATGIEEDCYDAFDEPTAPTREKDAYAIGGERRSLPYGLAFNKNAAVQGLLYAEILGQPKARRGHGA